MLLGVASVTEALQVEQRSYRNRSTRIRSSRISQPSLYAMCKTMPAARGSLTRVQRYNNAGYVTMAQETENGVYGATYAAATAIRIPDETVAIGMNIVIGEFDTLTCAPYNNVEVCVPDPLDALLPEICTMEPSVNISTIALNTELDPTMMGFHGVLHNQLDGDGLPEPVEVVGASLAGDETLIGDTDVDADGNIITWNDDGTANLFYQLTGDFNEVDETGADVVVVKPLACCKLSNTSDRRIERAARRYDMANVVGWEPVP